MYFPDFKLKIPDIITFIKEFTKYFKTVSPIIKELGEECHNGS